ncbi:hypothetical protein BcepSauron_067 [Burkholderia phage BcepSauron]|uniref:Uncharacterized protein n=1 Tax=Burkholderia phage BcepSauron TaxID=2530033 RepID=A0A482MK95_9CAUD|nr:hypothetical protein H1O17_gp067 [Burkholderia phage BcepSauron]QBQ74447.1 hypothetical protein BcepSauron_067 [Burkholderia phage BcepSauron]
MRNISYHTRLYSDNTRKVVGGSFGGAIDADTVNRLVQSHFTVVVKNSGTPVFVDREGREVTLYLSVDPRSTEKGARALKEWRAELARQVAEDERRQADEQAEIDRLMSGLSHAEIVRRLRGTE